MFRLPLSRPQQTASRFLRKPLSKTTPTANAFSTSSVCKAGNDTTADDEPTGTIATKGLELLTFGTPNGHKASIFLEELKEAYNGTPDYKFQSINIGQNIQKEPWFTKYGPNGRIPVLVDHDRGSLGIMEGAAIISYLIRHFDKEHRLSFTEDPDLSLQEQWVAWQHGGLGPMQGQANHFYRLGPERIPYPTQRYVGETERLWGVLDIRLKDRDYLVGPGRGKYSVADIANFSWVNFGFLAGIQMEEFENVFRWWKAVSARPGVQKGINVPSEPLTSKANYEQKKLEDEEYKQKEVELAGLLKEAQGKYNYKFAAP